MWLTLDWWKFLLERPKVGQSRWTCFWCRARGHPAGVWWFNVGGLEPDMHCMNCGDDLG